MSWGQARAIGSWSWCPGHIPGGARQKQDQGQVDTQVASPGWLYQCVHAMAALPLPSQYVGVTLLPGSYSCSSAPPDYGVQMHSEWLSKIMSRGVGQICILNHAIGNWVMLSAKHQEKKSVLWSLVLHQFRATPSAPPQGTFLSWFSETRALKNNMACFHNE